MSQLSLFDEPTIARYKNRFEISDGKHYLGYIEMDKPSNGTVVFEFKYCKGRAYGGADEVPIKHMQKYVRHTARHFLKLYRYRNEITEQTVWREYHIDQEGHHEKHIGRFEQPFVYATGTIK